MCDKIAESWNAIDKSGQPLTGQDVFNLHPKGELFWIPYCYDCACEGQLDGLLLYDNFYAKLFCLGLEKKYKNA